MSGFRYLLSIPDTYRSQDLYFAHILYLENMISYFFLIAFLYFLSFECPFCDLFYNQHLFFHLSYFSILSLNSCIYLMQHPFNIIFQFFLFNSTLLVRYSSFTFRTYFFMHFNSQDFKMQILLLYPRLFIFSYFTASLMLSFLFIAQTFFTFPCFSTQFYYNAQFCDFILKFFFFCMLRLTTFT